MAKTPSIDKAELDRTQRTDVRVDDPAAVWVEVHAGTDSYQIASPWVAAPSITDEQIAATVKAVELSLTTMRDRARAQQAGQQTI